MYTKTPLTINTSTNVEGGSIVAATFQYTEPPAASTSVSASSTRPASRSRRSSTAQTNRPVSRQTGHEQSTRRQRSNTQTSVTSPYQGSIASPPGMYVRALYDYEADDQTSLSFRQGDFIQVITQLESGWWDGFMEVTRGDGQVKEMRGWFPSNYCAVVNDPNDAAAQVQSPAGADDVSGESGTDDDYEITEGTLAAAATTALNGDPRHGDRARTEDADDQEEAAFWIPQATADGRLFYYNTLTGVSTMELPLETPTSNNETGPRDRTNIRVPDQTRPPPEMMARGYERNEDEGESEAEAEAQLYGRRPKQRRSYISDGASPSASIESLNASLGGRRRNDSRDTHDQSGSFLGPGAGNPAVSSYQGTILGHFSAIPLPSSFYDDGSLPRTWNRLVENMRKSVESYRQAINNADRADYVRKAEDISDHLRMLLAAGSGTTDNHSGNPSIISTNKALYPHFRDMMSRFSKLVLSSHIAAADWPAPDSYSKCLQEAEGVLQGVYGYVEVAKAQRGEEIQRLTPGFVVGSNIGGGWQNNNLGGEAPINGFAFMDQDDYEGYNEPSAKLDLSLLERLDDLKRMIVSSIRRLDEHLVLTEKIITPARHEQISSAICSAAGKVMNFFQPYISTVESINLAPLSSAAQSAHLHDFSIQKQRLYDMMSSLIIACQTVGGPLADEWSSIRGDPLDVRIQEVKSVSRHLETAVSQVGFTLQLLLESMPNEAAPRRSHEAQVRDMHRRTDGGHNYEPEQLRHISNALLRPQLGDIGHANSYSEGVAPPTDNNYREPNSKLHRFFGEMPTPSLPSRESEEWPEFLRLDHEGEIAYDTKTTPPQLRGGTLTALIEQLTRHDRLDASFNNTFLLTYRSFTTATELFEMLVKRFSIQPPRGISQDEYHVWVAQKQKPIRFRVVNILKSWFDQYWMEVNDATSSKLLERVYAFARDSVATTSTPGSGPLMAVVEQRMRGEEPTAKRMVLNLSSSVPHPIIPKNMKKLKFLDIDVTEFARQLTIIESKLYGKIKPSECLNKTWNRKIVPEEGDPAPNVKALILHSNQLTNWVAEMILTQSDVKRRVVVIKHFVTVADVRRHLF